MDLAVHRLPVLAHTGIRKFGQRPESFHPRQSVRHREAPEVGGFCRRRIQLGRDRQCRRHRAAPCRVDRRRRADDGSLSVRIIASPPQGDNSWLRARVGEVLRTALRGALAQPVSWSQVSRNDFRRCTR